MVDNTDELDKELEEIKLSSTLGNEKIEEAKRLLPVHYKNLMCSIGGNLEDTINFSRLPKPIAKLASLLEAETPTLGTLPNIMTATLAYTKLVGNFRPYVLEEIVAKTTQIPCNIYSVIISGSGSSKDSAFILADTCLKEATKLTRDTMSSRMETRAKAIAAKVNMEAQRKDSVPDDKLIKDDTSGYEQYIKQLPPEEISNATVEGLLSVAYDVEKSSSMGNIFLKLSELSNTLKSDPNIERLITTISQMYDLGKISESIVKTDSLKVGGIEAMGISVMMHSSPTLFETDVKVADKLKAIFGSYLGRRSFHMLTSLDESTDSVKLSDDLDKLASSMQNAVYNNIGIMEDIAKDGVSAVKNLLKDNDTNKITLSDGAKTLYAKYYIINRTYRTLAYLKNDIFSAEGVLAEISSRHWKAIKLAGVWSLAEGRSEISVSTMASAIYFTEFVGKGLRTIINSISQAPFERFLTNVHTNDIGTKIRFDSLIKKGFINKPSKIQIDEFLTTVNSAAKGTVVCKANYDKSIVVINRIEKNLGDYGTSIIKFKPEDSKEYRTDKSYKDFKYTRHTLEDMVQLLKGDFAYSPFKFKDGRRSNANVESETSYIVFDVDESDLPMDTLHETYLSGTSHIIATTSNKDNLHKFRLILPIKQKIGKDIPIYKYVLNRVADDLMLNIDPSGTVLSQIFFSYSGGVVLDNLKENIEPMDISDILADAGSSTTEAIDYSTPLTKAQQKKEQSYMYHDFDTAFAFVISAPNGRGSLLLYVAMRKMQRAGLDKASIETLLHKISSMWTNPMPLPRMQRIIGQL